MDDGCSRRRPIFAPVRALDVGGHVATRDNRVEWVTPAELREGREMLWLVQPDLVAAGEFERRHQTPAAVGDRRRFDPLLLELLYRRADVVADQPQFVFGVVFRL